MTWNSLHIYDHCFAHIQTCIYRQTFCTVRNEITLTYHTAHAHKVLLIPADKCPALMSGYHPISQWPWADWNMIGCHPESEI